MFAKPENWNQLSPEEKRKLRLDHWQKSEGLEFASPRAEVNCWERIRRAGVTEPILGHDRCCRSYTTAFRAGLIVA